MRTTIDIDEQLLEATVRHTGQPTKSKAVNEALAEYLRDQGLRKLLRLQGNLDLDLDDWYEFRHNEHD